MLLECLPATTGVSDFSTPRSWSTRSWLRWSPTSTRRFLPSWIAAKLLLVRHPAPSFPFYPCGATSLVWPQPSTVDQDGPSPLFALLECGFTMYMSLLMGTTLTLICGLGFLSLVVAETLQFAGLFLTVSVALKYPCPKRGWRRARWCRCLLLVILLGQAAGAGTRPGIFSDQQVVIAGLALAPAPAWGLWEMPTLHECFLAEKWCRQWVKDHPDPPDLGSREDPENRCPASFCLMSPTLRSSPFTCR